jgi:hypothetical protein
VRWDRRGYDDPDDDPVVTRNNGGAFVEARASVMNRAYLSGGVGVEHNEVFGTEAVPRFSAALYLRQPSAGSLGDTKVSFNVGKGIKSPSVFNEQNAPFELVQACPPRQHAAGRTGRSRGLTSPSNRASRATVTDSRRHFNNTFEDLLEYLGQTQLVRLECRPRCRQRPVRRGRQLAVGRRAGYGIVCRCGHWHTVRFGASAVSRRRSRRAFSASGDQSGVSRCADRRVLAARRRTPVPSARQPGTVFVSYATGPAAVTLAAYSPHARRQRS